MPILPWPFSDELKSTITRFLNNGLIQIKLIFFFSNEHNNGSVMIRGTIIKSLYTENYISAWLFLPNVFKIAKTMNCKTFDAPSPQKKKLMQ